MPVPLRITSAETAAYLAPSEEMVTPVEGTVPPATVAVTAAALAAFSATALGNLPSALP